jgi:hypothetical protein
MGAWWLTPVLIVTQEAEIPRPYLKANTHKKQAGVVDKNTCLARERHPEFKL